MLLEVLRLKIAAQEGDGLPQESRLLIVIRRHQVLDYVQKDDSVADALLLPRLHLVFVQNFVRALHKACLLVL